MPYTEIGNFGAGLDKRNLPLKVKPGALSGALNCQITEGGEVEKTSDIAQLESYENEAFGLVATDAYLYTFGSAASGPTSSNLTYQQLQHPAVLDGATYEAAKHAMTKVVSAEPVDNKPWVVAQFADGKRHCYYDGSLVRAFRDGKILDGLTSNVHVATQIKLMLDRVDDLTVESVEDLGDGTAAIQATGPAGESFTLEMDITNQDGSDGAVALVEQDASDGSEGTESVGQLGIVAGSEGGQVTKLEVGTDAAGWTEIIDSSTPLEWGASDTTTTFAVTIAAAINSYFEDVSTDLYRAVSGGATVFIKASALLGDSVNGYKIRVTVDSTNDGGVVFDRCAFTLGGQTGDQITSVTVEDVDDVAQEAMSGGAAVWDNSGTDAGWAAELVERISAGSQAVAVASGSLVYIGRRVSLQDGNTKDVVITSTRDAAITGTSVAAVGGEDSLTISMTPTSIGYYVKPGDYGDTLGTLYEWQYRAKEILAVAVSGGSGTYSGEWSFFSGNSLISWDQGSPWHHPVFTMPQRPGLDKLNLLQSPPTAIFMLEVVDDGAPVRARGISYVEVYSIVI